MPLSKNKPRLGIEFSNDHLKLVLMHHPIEWMQEFDQEELEVLLPRHLDVLLRGHLHRTRLTVQAEPGRQLHMVAAGSADAGSRHRNAYNVARVQFASRGRTLELWMRAFSVGERTYVMDVETYAAAEDGYVCWPLDARVDEPASKDSDPRPYLRRFDGSGDTILLDEGSGINPIW